MVEYYLACQALSALVKTKCAHPSDDAFRMQEVLNILHKALIPRGRRSCSISKHILYSKWGEVETIIARMGGPFQRYGNESAQRSGKQEYDDLSDNEGWDDDDDLEVDREWYLQDDDGGVAGDADHNPFAQYEDMHGQVSNVLARRQQRMTARQAQYNVDLDAWEKSRLQSGGVGGRQAVRDLSLIHI